MKDKQCRCTMHRFVKYITQALSFLKGHTRSGSFIKILCQKRTARHSASRTAHQINLLFPSLVVTMSVKLLVTHYTDLWVRIFSVFGYLFHCFNPQIKSALFCSVHTSSLTYSAYLCTLINKSHTHST